VDAVVAVTGHLTADPTDRVAERQGVAQVSNMRSSSTPRQRIHATTPIAPPIAPPYHTSPDPENTLPSRSCLTEAYFSIR